MSRLLPGFVLGHRGPRRGTSFRTFQRQGLCLPALIPPGRTRPTSDAETKLRKELASYVRLADNWDGNGAKAPLQAAVNDALTFLGSRPEDIPLPYPEEGAEGDVGVYWDRSDANVFAEVTFEGDGTCAYFAVHGVPGAITDKCGSDDIKVTSPWPDDMLRILRIQDSA